MTYAQIFNGVETAEKERRMEVIAKMNLLWDRKKACLEESKQKDLDEKIRKMARHEASWLKEAAWFLY